MRKFKFFALAFAALSFAACSDDAIDGQGGNTGTTGEGTPAYLTVSFSANAESSSRASDDENTGDKDGTVDDSGHSNAGTTDENAVKTALIVVVPADQTASGAGYAQLYTVSSEMNTTENEDATLTVDGGTNNKYYTTSGPLPIAATDAGITYEVLVVVNPASTLTNSTSFPNLGTGISDLATVRNLYNTIVNGNYSYQASATPNTGGDTYKNAAAQLGNSTSGFMMANRDRKTISVYSTNTIANPAKLDKPIDVERVLSKITFRPANITDNKPSYVYKTENSLETHHKALMEEGAYDESETVSANETTNAETQDGEETPTYVKGKFNVAKDLIDQNVYVLFSEQEDGSMKFEGVFKSTGTTSNQTNTSGLTIYKRMTPKTLTEYNAPATEETVTTADSRAWTESTNKEDWFVVNNDFDDDATGISEADILGSIQYVMDPDEEAVETKDIYVRIDGYALINLSKNVNYVRHTTTDPDAAMAEPFGSLANNTTYLWTPYWVEKNDVTFDSNGEFNGTPAVGTWFYNTLADVADETKGLRVTTSPSTSVDFTTKYTLDEDGNVTTTTANVEFFKPMPTSDSDNHNTDTDNGNHPSSGIGMAATPAVGYFLDYCYENSVVATQQRHGLTTGICFVATMWSNEACTEALQTLYRYAGNLFTSIKDINDAYAGTIKAIADLAKKEVNGDAISRSELDDAGIEPYSSNICYYYTTEIKHFDNGNENSMGIMEFAIMRNNIYSLVISKINDIGDPFIDPNPGTEDETSQAYMTIQAEILPWIVRYNDIEF